MSGPIDIATIAEGLADRIEALVAELLPAGRREGSEWRIGSVAGEAGRSMAVHLEGPRAGVWCDFGAADHMRGDALDLVAQVLYRGDKKRAFAWSRRWLGLEGGATPRPERRPADVIAKKERSAELDAAKRRSARALFFGAWPSIVNTPADHYLRNRGIDLAALGRQPKSLRYVPNCWNGESGRPWKALVAAITDRKGEICAIHRTWLELRGDGKIHKAPLLDPKKTLGRYAGGAIRLWKGASGKPLHQAAAGEWVTVTEGIEDGLTAALAEPQRRIIVAVSLSNMGSLWLPDAIAGVNIVAQNDKEPQAIAALERAIAHFHGLRKRVRIYRPPPGVKDINDLLQGERA